LHLPLECHVADRVSSNIFDSNHSGMWSSGGQGSHDNNWVVESTVDRDSVPDLSVGLIDSDTSEPDSCIATDLFLDSVEVQVTGGH
jgi:hypothetical protein